MAQRIKIEQMLENLINNDSARAEELFHEYIVEKSREIYEGLLEADFDEIDDSEMTDEKTDDFVSDVEDEEAGEDFGDEEESDEDEAPHSEEDEEERLQSIENTLEQILDTLQMQMDSDSSDDSGESTMFGPKTHEEESFEFEDFDDLETVREYVEKVGEPYKGGKVAGSTEHDVNKKSIVDNMKNDMGGTSANIVHGGEDGGKHDAPGAYSNKTKEENAGNVNVPGSKKAATLSSVSGGHGTEKKGKGEESGVNKTSLFRK